MFFDYREEFFKIQQVYGALQLSILLTQQNIYQYDKSSLEISNENATISTPFLKLFNIAK